MTSLWVQFKLFSNFISGTVLRGQVNQLLRLLLQASAMTAEKIADLVQELLELGQSTGLSISELVMANEKALQIK